ncbi:hypothetical protein [Paraburkholderia sp. 2C]
MQPTLLRIAMRAISICLTHAIGVVVLSRVALLRAADVVRLTGIARTTIDAFSVAAIAWAGLRRACSTLSRACRALHAAHNVARRIVADVVHRDLRRGIIAAGA